jgi:hypothetical protein
MSVVSWRSIVCIVSLGITMLFTSPAWALDSPEEQAAIQEIEKIGGTVRKIAANSEAKECAFHLSGTDLTDEGLAQVAKLTNLTWLNLRGTKITDAGLVHLKGLTELTRLHLEKTEIGDAGLPHLVGLTKLEYLNLYGTKVSDAGLDQLSQLKSLKRIYLWESAVTEEGAQKLREKLPETEVVLGAKLEPVKPAEEKKEEEKK